ncbi:putative NRPS-like protein biosynthetic cluster [Clathrus columnatus]|uniref:NRPS-like protein biosynthetic cluster n=1 Tax=Clathrus columnatus TaxID=1419009 RepID=A0AAV4ZYW3_9AGAM|nr:putative NRPS-like protein biosynthetic cluster [Clathrus columnatus]
MNMDPIPNTLTVDQRHDWYRVRMPDEPFFCYIGSDGSKVTHSLIHIRFINMMYMSMDIIKSEIPECQDESQEPLVVALLAGADYSTFTAFLYGFIRLTHPTTGRPLLPFLISPRNSAIAIAHLMKETKCGYVWVTDGTMKDLAEEAIEINTDIKPILRRFPSFNDLYQTEPSFLPETYDDTPVPISTLAVILHSSGSTSFPKIRIFTHEIILQWGLILKSTEYYSLEGELFAMSPPPYHAMGLFMTSVAVRSRLGLAVQSPHAPPGPMSADTFLELINSTDAAYVLCIPSFLEDWSKDPRARDILKRRKAIVSVKKPFFYTGIDRSFTFEVWGGGPFNRQIGARLYDEGVPLRTLYGATEFGTLNSPLGQIIKEGHEWFSFRPESQVALLPTDEDDVFQVVVKDCEIQRLSAHDTVVDGVLAFNTNDLVQRHPDNQTLYRIIGRADDQIMLSTGEKVGVLCHIPETNPGPLEDIIKRNPHIHDVIMFGRGRQSNGILVQPSSFEEAESLGVEGFRNLIWPSIEEANIYAPAHSRILKEMILIVSSSHPFTYTAKETLKKGVILTLYADKIDALYKDAEESVHAEIPIPLGTHPDGGWTEEESREFVSKVIYTVLRLDGKILDGTDDIFGFGCDSLQATYIRNTLLHALRQVAPLPNIRNLPSSFVYQSPTINALSQLIAQASRSEVYHHHHTDTLELRTKRLENMIQQYTSNWPVHHPQKEYVNDEEVILLTGSTGGLGSQLLAQLVRIPIVTKIYALNRPSGKSSYERHRDVFEDRGNDVELLNSSKIVFLEGDTSVSGFAITGANLFDEMRNSVTTIIHNAWNVNFNISLASFEPAIRGVRNLINFALSSPYSTPPRILFTSSVGTIKTWANMPPIKEEPFDDISLLQTSGYGESKWVSERILTIAELETGLKPVIIRVGQLSGGINGNWTTKEWFPSIITASRIIGSLPDYEGVASFVPVHKAASAIIELRHAPINFAHLVHPRPIKWTELIHSISDELQLPIIPFSDWVNQLENLPKTEEMFHKTHALHLIEFYKAAIPPPKGSATDSFSNEHEVMGLPTFETSRTVSAVEALNEVSLPCITTEEVVGWIGYWRAKGVLNE